MCKALCDTAILHRTASWFKAAVPEPNAKNEQTQIGVHFEEVAEMLAEIQGKDRMTQSMLTAAMVTVHGLALHLKNSDPSIEIKDRKKMIDALCDQTVTVVGSAHMMGMDIIGAMQEVNRSNYSKFVDGKPVFDANMKIIKGPDFFKPNLAPFV